MERSLWSEVDIVQAQVATTHLLHRLAIGIELHGEREIAHIRNVEAVSLREFAHHLFEQQRSGD